MKDIVFWISLSIVLTIIIEWINFRSIKKVFQFMIDSPIVFSINLLIVSSSLALGLLVKRRIFVFSIISLFWIILSVINVIVTSLRGYPLMFSDIFLIKEGLSLSAQYFTPLVMGAVTFLLSLLLWISYDLFQITLSISSFQYAIGISYVIFSIYLFNRIEKKQSTLHSSKSEELEDIGFAYAIADSIYPYLNRKPDTYDEEQMMQIKVALDSYLKPTLNPSLPNVILLQIESLFDPLLLQNLIISQDPIPTIRTLMKQSGQKTLSVPTFGGGTGKTEFEVLTGMNVDFLGPGEIPHNSFLRSTPVESLATSFKRYGYETIAIHNYEGNFYNRHLAYQNLGFDRFIPIEYMPGVQIEHDLAQMNDADLFDNLIHALNMVNPCFIYGITAGTHQPYDETTYDETHPIQIEGKLSLEVRASLQNYCLRLNHLDQQIARLLEVIGQHQTETILVLFSDHLPNLPVLTNESFYPYSLYEVPYLIAHSNIQINQNALEAYQLGALLLKGLGLTGGIMETIHLCYRNQENYLDILRQAQYDLIYGKNYLRNGEPITYSTEITFGLDPILISEVTLIDHHLIIKGQGFNQDSQLYLDYRKIPTTYINSTELQAELPLLKPTTVTLKQVSGHHQAIGHSIKINLPEI